MSRKLTRRHAQMVAVSQCNFILKHCGLSHNIWEWLNSFHVRDLVSNISACTTNYTIEVLSAVCNCMRKLSSSLHIDVCHLEWHTSPQTLRSSHSWVSVQHFYYWPKWQYCLFVFWGIKYHPFWTTTFSHPYDKRFLQKLSDTLYFIST